MRSGAACQRMRHRVRSRVRKAVPIGMRRKARTVPCSMDGTTVLSLRARGEGRDARERPGQTRGTQVQTKAKRDTIPPVQIPNYRVAVKPYGRHRRPQVQVASRMNSPFDPFARVGLRVGLRLAFVLLRASAFTFGVASVGELPGRLDRPPIQRTTRQGSPGG